MIFQELEFPTHKLLTVDTRDDRSNPHLRPDFVDRIFDDSSDDSLDDFYDRDDFDEFLRPGTGQIRSSFLYLN